MRLYSAIVFWGQSLEGILKVREDEARGLGTVEADISQIAARGERVSVERLAAWVVDVYDQKIGLPLARKLVVAWADRNVLVRWTERPREFEWISQLSCKPRSTITPEFRRSRLNRLIASDKPFDLIEAVGEALVVGLEVPENENINRLLSALQGKEASNGDD